MKVPLRRNYCRLLAAAAVPASAASAASASISTLPRPGGLNEFITAGDWTTFTRKQQHAYEVYIAKNAVNYNELKVETDFRRDTSKVIDSTFKKPPNNKITLKDALDSIQKSANSRKPKRLDLDLLQLV